MQNIRNKNNPGSHLADKMNAVYGLGVDYDLILDSIKLKYSHLYYDRGLKLDMSWEAYSDLINHIIDILGEHSKSYINTALTSKEMEIIIPMYRELVLEDIADKDRSAEEL